MGMFIGRRDGRDFARSVSSPHKFSAQPSFFVWEPAFVAPQWTCTTACAATRRGTRTAATCAAWCVVWMGGAERPFVFAPILLLGRAARRGRLFWQPGVQKNKPKPDRAGTKGGLVRQRDVDPPTPRPNPPQTLFTTTTHQVGHQAAACPNGTVNWRDKLGDDAYLDYFTVDPPCFPSDDAAKRPVIDPAAIEAAARAYAEERVKTGAAEKEPIPPPRKPKTVAVAAAGGAGPPLPDGWAQAVDAKGRTYYWNRRNKQQVTWTRPTAPAP